MGACREQIRDYKPRPGPRPEPRPGPPTSPAIKNQPNWENYKLPDKLEAAPEPKDKPPPPHKTASQQARKRAIAKALGLQEGQDAVRFKTPVGEAIFDRRTVNHIATRPDQRYQFSHLIRPTLEQPNEIWSTHMTNGEVRQIYIKQFANKACAVVVERLGDRVLTAIARSKPRDINRWRRGLAMRPPGPPDIFTRKKK